MLRRDLLRNAFRAAAVSATAPMVNRGHFSLFAGTRTYCDRTIRLVSESAVTDMLGLLTLDWERLDRWQTDPQTLSPQDLEKLWNSGVTVFHPAVEMASSDPRATATEIFTKWNGLIGSRPAEFLRINCARDIAAAKASGRIGILLGMQNSNHFRCVQDVAFFHALGQRVSQLTYNVKNLIGCGCGNREDTGLTPFGVSVVETMNRMGMGIDVSHAGERTTLDAIEASTRPVLITHSNCRALVPHPRCKSDAVIRAMAARGSVMGLTAIRAFVSRKPAATLEHLLDHYDHVIRLVGPEHVGIGSDSDPDGRDLQPGNRRRYGLPFEISGLNQGRRIFDLTQGLIRRRYTDADIRLILGGNAERVFASIFDSNAPVSVSPDSGK